MEILSLKSEREKAGYALVHPDYFMQRYFPNFDDPWHQLEWLKLAKAYPKLLLVAPCDHGKTTTMAEVYPIYSICRNRDVRIAIISNEESQTEGSLRRITEELETNEALIRDYGLFKPPRAQKWTDLEIIIAGRTRGIRDATVLGKGLGGQLQNRRIDIAILDDVISEKEYPLDGTLLQHRRVVNWFREVFLTRLSPGAQIKIIGTYQHYADLYHWVEEEIPKNGFACFKYKAMSESGKFREEKTS